MYRKYQKTALLEVITRDSEGNYIVRNEGDSSDVWKIPKSTFESTYKEVKCEKKS